MQKNRAELVRNTGGLGRRLRPIFSLVSAALFATSAVAADAYPEIGGLKFDIPHKQVPALLQKVGSGLQVEEVKTREGKPAGWTAVSAADRILVLTDDQQGTVWYVGRVQTLAPGSRINAEVLRKSLVEKYGEPTLGVGKGSVIMTWDYDRDGRHAAARPPQIDSGLCAAIGPSIPPIPRVPVTVPSRFLGTCGARMYVSYIEDPQDKLVSSWTIWMSHDSVRFDELNNVAQARAAAKAASRKEEAEKNRPKL